MHRYITNNKISYVSLTRLKKNQLKTTIYVLVGLLFSIMNHFNRQRHKDFKI